MIRIRSLGALLVLPLHVQHLLMVVCPCDLRCILCLIFKDAEVCRSFDFNEQVVDTSLIATNEAMKQLVDDIDHLRISLTAKVRLVCITLFYKEFASY
jgi:hypothetical protein